MELGDRIKALRKSKGMTQDDLAEKLKISRQAVAKWEQNVCEPALDSIVTMSEVFGCGLEYLITGSEKQPPLEPNTEIASVPAADSRRIPDRIDVILIILMVMSIALFWGLFIYAVLNPVTYHQFRSFVWWYLDVGRRFGFVLLALTSIAGFVSTLTIYLKRGKHKRSNKKDV